MKDHPLLYTSDMIIRILTCAKCDKISIKFPCCHCGSKEFCKTQTRRVPVERYRNWKVGDMIWVREAHQIQYANVSGICGIPRIISGVYKASPEKFEIQLTEEEWAKFKRRKRKGGNQSGRFMYKSLARIWLEITGLRVERVQEISFNDIYAEGFHIRSDLTNEFDKERIRMFAAEWWQKLWNTINAKRGYGWDKNPEVKVIEFKRIKI